MGANTHTISDGKGARKMVFAFNCLSSPSCSCWMIFVNFARNPSSARIFQKQLRLTVSKALERPTNTADTHVLFSTIFVDFYHGEYHI